jgi:preprotein translocase subunit SecE
VARKRGGKKKEKKQAVQKQLAKKQPAKKQPAKKQPRGIRLFFRETVGELRKVSWPTRKEALGLTYVVVIVMIIMAIFLGGIDFVFFRLFGLLFGA